MPFCEQTKNQPLGKFQEYVAATETNNQRRIVGTWGTSSGNESMEYTSKYIFDIYFFLVKSTC